MIRLDVALILALALPCVAASLYDAKRTSAPQYAAIPVTLGTTAQVRTVLALVIDDVRAGDVIAAHAYQQHRNDLGYNVELASWLELRETSTGTDPMGGIERSQPAGPNVIPTAHYGRGDAAWLFLPQRAYPRLFLCYRARARSTGAKPGHALVVSQGQGVLFYERFR